MNELWADDDFRRQWHEHNHVGVLFEECLVCQDDKLLFEEMEQTRDEDEEYGALIEDSQDVWQDDGVPGGYDDSEDDDED